MYLIIVQYISLISFWIVYQLKIVMKGEGFKRKKERKIEETVSLNITDSDKLSLPAITSHGNQVNTTSTLRQGQNRKRNWEIAPIIATTAITGNHNANDSLNSRRVAF